VAEDPVLREYRVDLDRHGRSGGRGLLDFRWRPKSESVVGEPGATPRNGIQAYGRGEYNPRAGIYEWYEAPESVFEQASRPTLTWLTIFEHWALLEADLHQHYGIDLGDKALLRSRDWRWLRVRIVGLCSIESRLSRALNPPEEKAPKGKTPATWED
jgi:hypothetical protein